MPEERPEPWKTGFRSYAGWVPNIRSHLSFSLIGAARDARSFTQPSFDSPTRIVLVLQNRTVNDYPMPERVARFFFPDIAGRWFMNAETTATDLPIRRNGEIKADRDRQGLLQGTIHFLPYHDDPDEEDHLRRELEKLARLLSTKRQFRDGPQVRELQVQATALVESAGRSIVYRFALMRTGELRLWYQDEVEGWSFGEHDQVAEQAYYFVKDVVHDHTHHDPTSDQITPLTLFDLSASEPGYESEVKWRRETMWSLSREVERLNRSGGVVDQHRALGIIAYAEEFQSSLMSHVRDASAPEGFRDDTTVHDFNFSHLKASIKSLIDMKSARLAQRIQKWIAAAAIFISCLALVSSLVSTHNAAIPRGPTGILERDLVTLGSLDWMLPVIAAEPLLTAVLVSVALLGLINYFIGDGPSYFNEVQRVLSQLARAIAVTTKFSTRAQRWMATGINLIFASASLIPCYVLFRLVLGGGSW